MKDKFSDSYVPLWAAQGTESCGPFNYEEKLDIDNIDLDSCIICDSTDLITTNRGLQLCSKCSGVEFLGNS